MATVVFLMDLYTSHLLPSLGLAGKLSETGHRVIYLAPPDAEAIIAKHGFEFHEVFSDEYPLGYIDRASPLDAYHHLAIVRGQLDEIIDEIKPDLFVTSYFQSFDALLLHYRFGIPQIIFNPHLRAPENTPHKFCSSRLMELPGKVVDEIILWAQSLDLNMSSLADWLEPVSQMPELTACPRALDFGEERYKEGMNYLGPSIRPEDPEARKVMYEMLPRDKHIVFAAMGSQAKMFPEESQFFYSKLVEAFTHPFAKDWHLVLATGQKNPKHLFGDYPSNVTVLDWAPQIEILSFASAAVVHGGLGTLKECVYYGVPMITYPITQEQNENAERVNHHQIGYPVDFSQISPRELAKKLYLLLSDKDIKANIAQMQEAFHHDVEHDPSIPLIESLIHA